MLRLVIPSQKQKKQSTPSYLDYNLKKTYWCSKIMGGVCCHEKSILSSSCRYFYYSNQSSPNFWQHNDDKRIFRWVSVLPQQKPKIENLAETYRVGDYLRVKCISAPGNPTPNLIFYINGQQVNQLLLLFNFKYKHILLDIYKKCH